MTVTTGNDEDENNKNNYNDMYIYKDQQRMWQ